MTAPVLAPTAKPPHGLNASYFRSLPTLERYNYLQSLDLTQLLWIQQSFFEFWARPEQQYPANPWDIWMIMAGRGAGKTRTGSEATKREVHEGRAKRIALVARTSADIRDVMLEGPSGIITLAHPDYRPKYEPSKRRVTWPDGQIAICFSADEPDQLRGPEHDWFWADELGSWPDAIGKQAADSWDNLMFGLRGGQRPRGVVTTTPRKTKMLRKVLRMPNIVVTRGSTYDNRENVPASYLSFLRTMYEGTRLGQQELYGILLEDNPDALWNIDNISDHRVAEAPAHMRRIVVAIDPAVTSLETSAETGIVVAGRSKARHMYTLADLSMRGTPLEWATVAVKAYHLFHADRIVAEVNNGGDMVGNLIAQVDRFVPYRAVRATRGKSIRAEPIAGIYEKGWAHHVGQFPELESQMCDWMPGERSPDRLDALVWAGTDLMLGGTVFKGGPVASEPRKQAPGYRH